MDTSHVPLILGPLRVILLSGSTPDCKESAVILSKAPALMPTVVDAFSFESRERCHAAMKLFDRQRLPAPANYFEESLNEQNEMLEGRSPSTVYLEFTAFLHKLFGHDVLGRWVVERATFYRKLQAKQQVEAVRTLIIMDRAPAPAYKRVIGEFGANNVTNVVLRRRGVHPFPVPLDGIRTIQVSVEGDSPSDLESAIRDAAPGFYIEIATSLPE